MVDKEDAGSETFVVSRKAQLKILLHGAKYPWADVQGVAIGIEEDKIIKVIDVIPLFHTVVFAPALETALLLVEEYCKSSQTPEGCDIVGWYHGHSRSNYNGLAKGPLRIVKKLKHKKKVCFIEIDSSALSDESQPGIKIYGSAANTTSWVESVVSRVEDNTASKEFTKMLKMNEQEKIHDFDSWLDDTSLDWRNLDLIK